MKRKEEPQKRNQFCGACAYGEWYNSPYNSDINGLPISLICTYRKKRKLRSEYGCSLWKAKKSGEMIITPFEQNNINKEWKKQTKTLD